MSDNLGSFWPEPESAANVDNQPQYPYNNITQTESGHTFEMDDTPGRERVRLQHRTETFIEMSPNGDQVVKIQGDSYEITIKDRNILVQGNINITVNGNASINVEGNVTERVKGNYDQLIEGDFTQVVKGKTKLISDSDISIIANPNFGGVLNLIAGGHIQAYSDLHVSGDITGAKIMSETRIDAGTGVSAGPLGFVSVTGGLSVGIPIAIPGTVMAAGMVNAGISMNAPLATFGTMMATFMTDSINTRLYNCHFHYAAHGPTSSPTPPMI